MNNRPGQLYIIVHILMYTNLIVVWRMGSGSTVIRETEIIRVCINWIRRRIRANGVDWRTKFRGIMSCSLICVNQISLVPGLRPCTSMQIPREQLPGAAGTAASNYLGNYLANEFKRSSRDD
jgi:hypothetical protein